MRHDEAEDVGQPDPLSSVPTTAAPDEPEALAERDGVSRQGAFSGGLWSAASAVLPMAGTLALSVVIGRRLGTTDLGEQSLVAYVAGSITHVLVFSVTTASVQLLASAVGAGEPGRAAWLARWSYRVHLATGVVAALLMIAVGLTRADYQLLWYLVAVVTFVDAIGWAHACRNIAQDGWGLTSSRRLVAQTVNPFLAIVAISAGLGIASVFEVQLVVSVILTLLLRRIDRRTNRLPRAEPPPPPWRPVLRLWGMFVLSGLIFQIVERRLELVFLDHYQDARTVAMYSVAFSLVAIPTTVLATVIGAAMPAIAARSAARPEAVLPVLSRAARVLVALELVVVAGTVSVGPALVRVAYGAAFDEASHLVRYLGFILLLAPLGQLYATFWSGTGRLRPVLLAGGLAAVVDVALAWVLVPRLAGAGAVVATMSAQAVSALVLVGYTIRTGARLDLRPKGLARVLVVVLVAGGAALALDHVLPGIWGLLAATAAFLLITVAANRFLGLLDRADLEWAAGTIPGPAARLVRRLSPRA